MNTWIKKSIELANSNGYLDKLSNVYPVNIGVGREINQKKRKDIEVAFKNKNKKELILTLLELERFPFDDPYVGFIRKDPKALDKNPATTKRISERLFRTGLEGIIDGSLRPSSSSRQMGQMFQKWLYKLNYPILKPDNFLTTKSQVAILAGGDKALKEFAHKKLGYKGPKGLDLVFKVGDKFVIGEAKFISTSGGTQDKSFRETINFIKKKDKKTIRIAVIDGVVWLSANKAARKAKNLYQTVRNLSNNQIALSSLLLNDFLKSF